MNVVDVILQKFYQYDLYNDNKIEDYVRVTKHGTKDTKPQTIYYIYKLRER